jgi:hypothetical protein
MHIRNLQDIKNAVDNIVVQESKSKFVRISNNMQDIKVSDAKAKAMVDSILTKLPHYLFEASIRGLDVAPEYKDLQEILDRKEKVIKMPENPIISRISVPNFAKLIGISVSDDGLDDNYCGKPEQKW